MPSYHGLLDLGFAKNNRNFNRDEAAPSAEFVSGLDGERGNEGREMSFAHRKVNVSGLWKLVLDSDEGIEN